MYQLGMKDVGGLPGREKWVNAPSGRWQRSPARAKALSGAPNSLEKTDKDLQ